MRRKLFLFYAINNIKGLIIGNNNVALLYNNGYSKFALLAAA
jgi:hypothetical protein